MQPQFGVSSLNRHHSPSAYIYFCFACGRCHARLCHFFPDAGKCRFAEFFLGFLLHRTSMMASRPKQNSPVWNSSNNPQQTPPCVGWASRPHVPAKVKAQAEAEARERAALGSSIQADARLARHFCWEWAKQMSRGIWTGAEPIGLMQPLSVPTGPALGSRKLYSELAAVCRRITWYSEAIQTRGSWASEEWHHYWRGWVIRIDALR